MALKLRSAGSDLFNIREQVTPKLHQIKKGPERSPNLLTLFIQSKQLTNISYREEMVWNGILNLETECYILGSLFQSLKLPCKC